MVDFDQHAALVEFLVLVDVLHRQDRPARDVELVERIHDLELGLGDRPFLDDREAFGDTRQPRLGGRVVWVVDQLLAADDLHQRRPRGRLDNHIDVVIGAAWSAAQCRAGLTTARGVAGARHLVAELLVRVLRQRPLYNALLVAHLDPAQIQHRIGHRDLHPLALAGALALEERGEDAGDEVDAGAAVADLRPGDCRRTVFPAGRAGRAAHALRDILIGLEIGVAAGAEPLDRGVDDARVEFLEARPGEALPVEDPRPKIFDNYVAAAHQLFHYLFA